ncbi:MAG: hypothetical protein KC731_11330 [Myxococcales bacterium]|nr:hypothetical protein [Myxococcales bacterium]
MSTPPSRPTPDLCHQPFHDFGIAEREAEALARELEDNLGVILARVEAALATTTLDQPHREHLNAIQAAAERSATLTNQVSSLVGSERQRAFSLLRIDELLEGMLKMLGRRMGSRILLIWQPGSATWPIEANGPLLTRLIESLCANACDAIDEVGTVTIETSNVSLDDPDQPRGDYVQLSITDDGCGMGEETQARAFEPFFSTKPDGAGMGLAVVCHVVKQHGGFVQLTSTLGRGTTVHIHLPRCVARLS